MGKTVIIYEDDTALRKQLEYVFYAIREDFLLLASFEHPDQVLEHMANYKPDIVIMDIQMNSDDDGLNGLNRIKNHFPHIKVMMLTTFDVDEKVFNAICLGADGYMLKTDFSSQQLPHEAMRKSIRTIFDGGAYLTPSVAKRILSLFSDISIVDKIQKAKSRFQMVFHKSNDDATEKTKLTKMQVAVLKKIIEGKSTAEIARDLELKENTINTHIKGIYDVLEVHSRAQAIKKVHEERWRILGL